ncbi:hypothetical protein GQ600_3990 [Phytophthora cactorum]|nr:hypothetical protein GQ600_3990 [Phytophthora cactorum]
MGTKFTTYEYPHNLNSIAIQSGSSYGLFLYETTQADVVRIHLRLGDSGLKLIRYSRADPMDIVAGSTAQWSSTWEDPCYGGGLGCNLRLATILDASQLKMTLTAFWTVGCRFEGQQAGLSEAWFTIYPSIAQLMLMYYSLLNALAKTTRRRMTDTLLCLRWHSYV